MSDNVDNDNLINTVSVREPLYGAGLKAKKSFFVGTFIVGVCLILVLLAETLFITFYTGIYIIDGSMTPTLTGATSPYSKGGDYIYINTRVKPDYGNIVVVYSPNTSNGYTDKLIKRVVAFGGDWVELKEGVLLVNEEPVKEDYLIPEKNNPDNEYNTFSKHRVADGCMFLLGDNRNESRDSRDKRYGDIPLKNLVGVVPDWSLRTKSSSTAFYTFFHFTLFGN